jgi:hypothetical protein
MTDWEERLPPIVRERLARTGDMTSEERERMKDSEVVDSLLSRFYRDELDSEGLWKRLKELHEVGKGHLLREVQLRLIDSLSLNSGSADVQKRKEGILALEGLKDEQHTSAVEGGLNSIADLPRRYADEMQRVYEQLRAQVERDPQLRIEQVRQGQNTALVQLSVEEAVKRNPQWRDFLAQHESRYSEEFARMVQRLKDEVGEAV